MEAIYHIPAMLQETIEGLAIKPGGVYVDVTFGGGGHSRAILEELAYPRPLPEGKGEKPHTNPSFEGEGYEKGHLYSFDQDEEALQNAIDNPNWTFVHSNFRYLRNWMDYYGVKEIDGLLADLGVSFHHFDCPERGFSFRFSAPLDMRMNQTGKRTAADIVNGYSEEELARIFWLYGEMKNGRGIARNICKARSQKPILRTEELIQNLSPTLSSREGGILLLENGEIEVPAQYKKDLARLFQALRIEVNDEMGALREMLVAAKDLLKPGGRIAVLTYHSLEDRLVKNFFRSGNLEGEIEKDFYGNIITPFKVIEKGREASAEEVERNPRSRSAKLRVAEKLTPP
ncbi:MAG: 16S rRNA (cytosine(1402)-N(4))-methyltransferase RsmH [Paludibacteraceae bacterium]|nr:16S rRNA (cytosine(1402)-N(4))-methyltransferase RsmH [Paludibacteraceae bacterium]